ASTLSGNRAPATIGLACPGRVQSVALEPENLLDSGAPMNLQKPVRSRSLPSRRQMRLILERLEERLAPAAGQLLYPATRSMALLLRAAGSDIQVVYADSPSTVLASRSLLEITDGIRIVGNGYNVNLTIDLGVPRVRGGIFFDAGSGTNTLTGPTVDTTWHV